MSRRLISIFLMGLASGLPLALTSTTLQAWFTESSVNLLAIGFLSMLGMPYTFKFLWAPLMDYYPFAMNGGRRKGWILVFQFGIASLLMLMAQLNPSLQPFLVGMVALGIAALSASLDIVIDAYRTELLLPHERGLGASYFIFAYRIALLIAGGLALILAAYWGWAATYRLMAVFMLVLMIPIWQAPMLQEDREHDANLWQTMHKAMMDILKREYILLLLLFIVLYKFGDALALSLMTNFLLHGLGFTLVEVGAAYKVVSFIAIILGAMVGGAALKTWPIYRGLLVFGLAQAFSNLLFVILASAGKMMSLMLISIFVENFCSGLSTAALFAFLMGLCRSHYAATQFALLSALASLGRVFLGPVASVMVVHWGWVGFYTCAFLLSFPGLFLLSVISHEKLIEDSI